MIADTSLKAYIEIQQEGVVGKDKQMVYDYILSHPHKTDAETTYGLGFGDNYNKIRPRRRELVLKGLVQQSGKKMCSMTDRTAKCWEIKK